MFVGKRRYLKSAFLVAALLAADLRYSAAIAQPALWETRVFNTKCPTDAEGSGTALAPLLIALGTLLLPKLVDFGFSLANQTLQAKKVEEQSKNDVRLADGVGIVSSFYEAREDEGQPKITPYLNRQCLVVVRGNFTSPDKSDYKPDRCTKLFKAAGLEGKTSCNWLRAQGVDELGIYLEARYIFSDDSTNFRLAPNHFAFLKPIKSNKATSDGDGSDGRTGTYDLTYTATYESAAPGQNTSAFAMTTLVFEQLVPGVVMNSSHFANNDKVNFEGKTSAWTSALTPAAPQLAELQKILTLYNNRDEQDKLVKNLPKQITLSAEKVGERTNELLTLLNRPALAPAADPLVAGAALADEVVNGDLSDDQIQNLILDADPATNPTGPDIVKKLSARKAKLRANATIRAKASELKTIVNAALKQKEDKTKADIELKRVKTEIDEWKTKQHRFGPINVKLNLREQPHLPTNFFLLTAADAFAASKADLSQFASQTLLQTLNLQGKDAEIKQLSDQATLIMAANTALNSAKVAEFQLAALPSDASLQARSDAVTTLENAKIAANVAAQKACQPPPYPDSFGGKTTIHAC